MTVHGRHIAVGGKAPGDAGAVDELVGEPQVEGRQAERAVVDDLHSRAAASEYHHGAEDRILGQSRDEFALLADPDHGLDREAGDSRIRPQAPDAGDDVGGRLADVRFACEAEADASDVGLVDDVGRDELEGDGAALGNDAPACRGGGIRVGGEGERQARDAVSGQHARDRDRIEPRAPFRDCNLNDCACALPVG